MNNTTKASAIRTILSKELSEYEKHAIELETEINEREIERQLALLANETPSEKKLKTLQAVAFLLKSINY
jgi:hypothetical protein